MITSIKAHHPGMGGASEAMSGVECDAETPLASFAIPLQQVSPPRCRKDSTRPGSAMARL